MNKICLYGWFPFPSHYEHELNLNALLKLEDVSNLNIEDLSCPDHQMNFKQEIEPARFKRYLRAQISCRLKNIRNILPYLGYEATDVQKLEQTVQNILESKFSSREKGGYF